MNNADKPAYPVEHKHQPENGDWPTFIEGENGLTKREKIAANNMASMLSKYGTTDNDFYEYVAERSVKAADILLKQLEETQ